MQIYAKLSTRAYIIVHTFGVPLFALFWKNVKPVIHKQQEFKNKDDDKDDGTMTTNKDSNNLSNTPKEENNKEETEERPPLPDSPSAERVSTDTEAIPAPASFTIYELRDLDSTAFIDLMRDLPADGWGRPSFPICKCNKIIDPNQSMNNDGNE